MSVNIAIDGPAGAGKTTIAKRLGAELNFVYVDTGAMYRAIALYMLRHGIGADDDEAVRAACEEISIDIRFKDGVQYVYLNGENVNGLIRTEEVSQNASRFSALAPVRDRLMQLQRRLASENDVIMDGRDIGTCVLPDADVKIFLTANSDVRAMRRYREQKEKGSDCSLDEVGKEITERDFRDTHRAIAPLKKADDAVTLDTSDMTIDEVIGSIKKIIADKTDRKV